jgi:hypothetical protein
VFRCFASELKSVFALADLDNQVAFWEVPRWRNPAERLTFIHGVNTFLFSFRLIPLGILLSVSLNASAAQPASPAASIRSPHGKLDIPCQDCHTTENWKPIRSRTEFKHSQTSFPLRGRHTVVACRDCHADLNFANAPSKCQDCHADLHRRKNGAECELCHNTNGWEVSIHNINEHQDRFPLIGAHAVVDCYSCHKVGTVGQFNRFGLSTECVSCHMNVYQKTTAPNHRALGYSTECRECHLSMDSWMGAVFAPGNIPK